MNPNKSLKDVTMLEERQPSYPLRMPDDVRHELQQEANKNLRSLNNEILFRLMATLVKAQSGEVRA
jgi:hypothetical protein